MDRATRKLQIRCNITSHRFILSAVGENWEAAFGSFDSAWDEAEQRVAEVTALALLTEFGDPFLETEVFPAPTELVPFSHPLMGRKSRRI